MSRQVWIGVFLAVILAWANLASPARADFLLSGNASSSIENTNASFTALVSLTTDSNAGTQTVTVLLTNTSPTPDPGGFLTAVAFNMPDGSVYVANSYTTTDADFDFIDTPVGTSPWPDHDFGAALGGSWLGGGSPNPGLASGDSATFGFTFSGTSLTEADLLAAFLGSPDPSNPSQGDPGFVVRFRGLSDDRSDKVYGTLVPEPSSLVLASIGGMGLAVVMARRRGRA